MPKLPGSREGDFPATPRETCYGLLMNRVTKIIISDNATTDPVVNTKLPEMLKTLCEPAKPLHHIRSPSRHKASPPFAGDS
jgi:hypothetical protein